MEFGGRYILNAPRDRVWSALNDAEMLKAAIPGCETIAWTGPESLDLAIRVDFGVVKPVFRGELGLEVIEAAERYRLSGRGKGGLLGLAHGAADITLADHAEGTLLAFVAEGGASGQIMRLGRALIGNSAQKVIDGFFERFAGAMDVGIQTLPPR